MIFELVRDFADVVAAMPEGHPRHRILKLLDEAVRRDVHFIDRHPTTLFQCLWNSCWWYDCPEARNQYDLSTRTGTGPLPWEAPDGQRVFRLLESWRAQRELETPGSRWLRALRPPRVQLGTGQRMVLRGHTAWVRAVAFSTDGRWIATTAAEGPIHVWDACTGQAVAVLTGQLGNYSTALAFTPDSRRIAAANLAGISVWDLYTGQEVLVLRADSGSVQAVSFSADGQRLCLASQSSELDNPESLFWWEVRVWDVTSGRLLLSRRGGAASHQAGAAFSADGERFATTDNMDGLVTVWDARTGRQQLTFEAGGARLAFAPDGLCLAVLGDGVTLFDADTGRERAVLASSPLAGSSLMDGLLVTFSQDGRYLAQVVSSGRSTAVRLWDVPSRRELRTLARFAGVHKFVAVAFAPDCKTIALSTSDNSVQVWDATDEPEALSLIRRDKSHSPEESSATMDSNHDRSVAFDRVESAWRLTTDALETTITDSVTAAPVAWYQGMLIGRVVLEGPLESAS